MPEVVVAPTRVAEASRAWMLVAAVLFVLSVVAVTLAWKTDQRVASLEQELVRRQQASATQATEAKVLAGQAQDGQRDAAAKVALLEARVAEVAIQRGQLEDLIQSLSRSRDENLLVDVEAAIRVALQQGAITGSAEPLVATLRQADERLARYNQPRLEGVRRAITRDLDRVKAVGTTDIPSLTLKLDEAMRMVDELPLLSVAEARANGSPARPITAATGSAPGTAAASGGASASAKTVSPAASSTVVPSPWSWTQGWQSSWSRFTDTVWTELRSLVRVTRIDHPDAVLLAPEQAYFVRENLKLRLLNARVALAEPTVLAGPGRSCRWPRPLSTATSTAARVAPTRRSTWSSKWEAQARQVALPRPDQTLAALAAANAGR